MDVGWHKPNKSQGLWQQRQGFLTAAAKREQRHLAEAEAEVLRHVAKLVPEAEVLLHITWVQEGTLYLNDHQ